MSQHLERDLEALENEILAVSALVEEMIGKACHSLRVGRCDLARQVIESDARVDFREVQIEENCLKILALHQPVAIDLRRTAAILKTNNDLERIADLAVNIAQRSERLGDHRDETIPETLNRMADAAAHMVREALDSLVNLDPEAARVVCATDDQVDTFKVEVSDELQMRMESDASSIAFCLACYATARDLERIADHATNIAEDVIYLVEGEIARHRCGHDNQTGCPAQSNS